MSTYLCLCKCAQVQEIKANVFSHCPTANFHRTTPESRYQTPWQEDWREIKRRRERNWDVRPQRCFWFYITGYLQLCRCVYLWGVDSELLGLVETAKCCIAAVGLGGIDGRLGVLEGKRYVCKLQTVVPSEVMTTCAPSAWFTDEQDLSSLQNLWQDTQDAVNNLNTPNDRCVHLLCEELL